MIRGIDARITPEILHALASMGHGDSVVISDCNFPSNSVAQSTNYGQAIEWTLDAITALELTLSVIPIDTFDLQNAPVKGMQVVDDPNEIPEVIANAKPMLKQHNSDIELVERFAFYDLAKNAFVILRTTETLPYGNFLLRKGVL